MKGIYQYRHKGSGLIMNDINEIGTSVLGERLSEQNLQSGHQKQSTQKRQRRSSSKNKGDLILEKLAGLNLR